MYINTTGLVLRETEYKESSRILTVLTGTEGKLTVSARGAKRKGSKTASATQFLSYSQMTLYRGRDNHWTLTEAAGIELFEGLREELERLSLGAYFAEVMENVSDEDAPNPEILALGLNSLYALSENLRPAEVIKAGFELKMMALAGFEPMLEGCSVCGEMMPEKCRLDLVGGLIYCHKCGGADELTAALSSGALAAMRYILNAEPKRIFSFSLGELAMGELSRAAERYLQIQMDREFKTLEYYKKIKI
ncbi:MAG: DNA repair protein RecO [Oscillospiraceae bacterium]|nr:DNA repair protein RecO [Oscillospiraceae bacterium]